MKISQLHKSTGLWIYNKEVGEISFEGIVLKSLSINFEKGSILEFIDLVHPDEQKEFIEFLAQDKEQLISDIEVLLKNKSNAFELFIFSILTSNNEETKGIFKIANKAENYQTTDYNSYQQLKSAVQIKKLGYWRFDVTFQELTWSREVYNIWEEDPKDYKVSFENFFSSIHPDDLEVFQQAQDKAISEGKELNFEHRIILRNGKIKWVKEIGRLVKDKFNNAISFEGTVRDITAEIEDQKRQKLLESAVINTRDPILITTNEIKVHFVNHAFEKMTGFTSSEILGKSLDFLHAAETDQNEIKKIYNAIHKGLSQEFTILNKHKNNSHYWVRFNISPVKNNRGEIDFWVAIYRDITKEVSEKQALLLKDEISKSFQNNNGIHEVIKAINKNISDFGKFDFTELWLKDEYDMVLNKVAEDYTSETGQNFLMSCKDFNKTSLNLGLPGIVLKENKRIDLDLMQNGENFIRLKPAIDQKIRYMTGIPFQHDGKSIGVLVIGNNEKRKFKIANLSAIESAVEFISSHIQKKQLEQDLFQLFNLTSDIVFTLNTEGYFKKINPSTKLIFKESETQLRQLKFLNYCYPEDLELLNAKLQKVFNGEIVSNFESRIIIDNKYFWINWTFTPLIEQNIIYVIGKDISNAKLLSKLLDDANKLSKIGSWEYIVEENKLTSSPITKEIYGISQNEQLDINTSINHYKEGNHRELVRQSVKNLIEKGIEYDIEVIIVNRKEVERWVRLIGNAEFIQGKCYRIFGSIQDIHERKISEIQKEETLKERNRILESIGDGFLALNDKLQILYFNKVAEKLLNSKREKAVGKSLWEIFPIGKNLGYKNQLLKSLNDGVPVHFEGYFEVLNIFLEVSIFPIENGVTIYFRDITERKTTEEKLFESNERFQKVAEATAEAIWDWDLKSNNLFLGAGFELLFNIDTKDKKLNEKLFFDIIHPKDVSKVKSQINELLIGKKTKYNQIYRVKDQNGNNKIVNNKGLAIFDKDKNLIRIVGAIRDITEEFNRNNEIIKYINEISDKNNKLDEIAWIQSHELRAPLARLMSIVELFSLGNHSEEEQKFYLNQINNTSKELDQLIRSIIDKTF